MLKRTNDETADSEAAEVAAIAAGIFSALGAAQPNPGNGSRMADDANSKWKDASRHGALR